MQQFDISSDNDSDLETGLSLDEIIMKTQAKSSGKTEAIEDAD